MELKKVLMVSVISIASTTCVIGQKNDYNYYQPRITKNYEDYNQGENSELSLNVEEEGLSGFQRDAGLMLRKEKHTKKADKRMERAYERSAKKQQKANKLEDKKIEETPACLSAGEPKNEPKVCIAMMAEDYLLNI